MTFGRRTKSCWPTRTTRTLMRNASTVAEAPNRQASAISTTTPAAGLNPERTVQAVADRALASGLLRSYTRPLTYASRGDRAPEKHASHPPSHLTLLHYSVG